MTPAEALDDRRQRAREAAYDNVSRVSRCPDVEEAIVIATRVRVDDDLLSAACFASGLHENLYGASIRAALRAAFAAAGFEIEK